MYVLKLQTLRGKGKHAHSYHSVHSSRFLYPEGLHHLEDIHHSLSLAPLNGSDYGTEHATAAHCVTAGESNISRLPVLCMLLMEEGGRTIIGNKEKVGPANWTNSIGHDKAL